MRPRARADADVAAVRSAARSAWLHVIDLCGYEARLRSADRVVLEQTILPAYAARSDVSRVLFVGCSPWTRHYERLFDGREYWTIDAARWRRRYGATAHVCTRLEELGRHFACNSLDLILCNGVVGWGLDDLARCEQAFTACHRTLREAGELVLGWNDAPGHRRVRPNHIAALRAFQPLVFGPLRAQKYAVPGESRHVFEFYRK